MGSARELSANRRRAVFFYTLVDPMSSLYRGTRIGEALDTTLNQMVTEDYFGPDPAERVRAKFDQSMTAALRDNSLNNAKGTIKGKLHTYRFCDGVWTFVLQDATYHTDKNEGADGIDALRIVAAEAI